VADQTLRSTLHFQAIRRKLESRAKPLGLKPVTASLSRGAHADRKADQYADYEAPSVRLRLRQDRGQIYLQLTSPAELNSSGETSLWYPLEGILEFLGEGPADGDVVPSVDEEIEGLVRSWNLVVQCFSSWAVNRRQFDVFFRGRFDQRIAPRRRS